MSLSKKIAYSGMVIALYILLVFVTQNISFGMYQVRLATAVYALAYSNPYLILPLGLANMLSNLLMGGLGVYDIFGGFLVGVLTSGSVFLIGRHTSIGLLIVAPIAIIPSTVVPVWLAPILGVPYLSLVQLLFLGQVVSAYTLGIFFVKNHAVRKVLLGNQAESA